LRVAELEENFSQIQAILSRQDLAAEERIQLALHK
jgi:hypothetical protein